MSTMGPQGLMHAYLEGQEVPSERIHAVLRKATL